MSSLKDSEISQTLDVANAGARYDAAARKLVAQKPILAYILKSTMDEFADVPVKRIAEELIEDFPSVKWPFFRIRQIFYQQRKGA